MQFWNLSIPKNVRKSKSKSKWVGPTSRNLSIHSIGFKLIANSCMCNFGICKFSENMENHNQIIINIIIIIGKITS
jgi:hypothetical protein